MAFPERLSSLYESLADSMYWLLKILLNNRHNHNIYWLNIPRKGQGKWQ